MDNRWYELADISAALSDGGWRSADRDELQAEYKFSDEETDIICQFLARFEAEDELEED